MSNQVKAIVTEASDKIWQSDVKYRKNDGDPGGSRTKIRATLDVSDDVAAFLGLSETENLPVWAGGWGEPADRAFKYLRSLRTGDEVQLQTYTKKDGSTDFNVNVPDGWTPETAAQEASAPPAQNKEPVNQNARAVVYEDIGAQYAGAAPLTPEQRLHCLVKLSDAEWALKEAIEAAARVLPDGTSGDQVARTATSLLIETAIWDVRKVRFSAQANDMRNPYTPAQLYMKFKNVDGTTKPSPDQVKYAVASMGKIFNEDERHAFLGRMFGVESTNDLSAEQLSMIIDWVGATEKNGYRPSLEARVEAGLIKEVL